MKVYVDAWTYVTEKFVNMGNIELYEGALRYEKADYPPIPSFILRFAPLAYYCILYQCLLYTSRAQQARGGRPIAYLTQNKIGRYPSEYSLLGHIYLTAILPAVHKLLPGNIQIPEASSKNPVRKSKSLRFFLHRSVLRA